MIDDERKFKAFFDDDRLTLFVEGLTDDGQLMRVSFRWRDEDALDGDLERTLALGERMIREAQPAGTVLGKLKPGAESWTKTWNVSRRKKFALAGFTGHEYDEAAVLLGGLKIVWPISDRGHIRWNRIRFEKNESRPLIFGIGGARKGWSFSLRDRKNSH